MVPSRSSNFFGTEVEGRHDEAIAGSNSGMVLKLFPFIFFLERTSRRLCPLYNL